MALRQSQTPTASFDQSTDHADTRHLPADRRLPVRGLHAADRGRATGRPDVLGHSTKVVTNTVAWSGGDWEAGAPGERELEPDRGGRVLTGRLHRVGGRLMDPCSLPVVSTVCGAAGSAVSAAAGGFWSSAAQMLATAQAELLKILFTAWLGIPTPGLTGAGSPVGFLQAHLSGLVGAAAVCGMIAAGIPDDVRVPPRTHRRGVEGDDADRHHHRRRIGGHRLLSAAGDAFSTWIVAQAAGGASVAQTFTADANLSLATSMSPGVILLLAPLSMVGMLIQIALLLCRSTFLVILTGCWPLAAAASTTEDGRTWYRRLTGWIIAFLLFKPVAGIIYATAIRMLTGGSSNELDVIEGVILLTMACLALPALLRLVAPMTGRLGGIGTAEVLGAAVGVAAGAAMVVGTGGLGAAAPAAGARPGLPGRVRVPVAAGWSVWPAAAGGPAGPSPGGGGDAGNGSGGGPIGGPGGPAGSGSGRGGAEQVPGVSGPEGGEPNGDGASAPSPPPPPLLPSPSALPAGGEGSAHSPTPGPSPGQSPG